MARRCAHCGDELPADHKWVYCWDGLEEFGQRQREIEEDPFITCVAYGDFTDPRNGRNGVVVRCRRIRGKEIRQMVRAIEEAVRPWLDKGRGKTRRVGLEPEPIPYFGVDRLWCDTGFSIIGCAPHQLACCRSRDICKKFLHGS